MIIKEGDLTYTLYGVLVHARGSRHSGDYWHSTQSFLTRKEYGAQSTEEKQRLYKLMRNLNFNGESGSESYVPTGQNVSEEGFCSPEFRRDFGVGLLDLHSMDDTKILSEE
ncbi:unnamed protein product [Amaranthus hypochondriacus]